MIRYSDVIYNTFCGIKTLDILFVEYQILISTSLLSSLLLLTFVLYSSFIYDNS